MSALVGVIASFMTPGPYVVTRERAGTYVKGRAVLGPTSLSFSNIAVASVDFALDTLTMTAHGLETGDGPVRLETDDTLPAGLSTGTDYWVIVLDANTIQLAATLDDATQVAPVAVPVTFTDAGVGNHTLVDTVDTVRQNTWMFIIIASIQPVTGRMIDDLAEGQSSEDVRIVYTTTELRNRQPGFEPDMITLDGEDYIVDKIERWQAFGGVHYRAQAIRITVP